MTTTRTNIRSVVRGVLDDIERSGSTITPSRVEEIIAEQYADDLASEADRLARRQVRSIAREMLTDSAKNQQMQFESMAFPRWVTLADHADGYVPLRTCTVGQYRDYVTVVLDQNLRAAAAEHQRHQAQLKTILAAGHTDDELLVDAASAL